MRKTFAVFLSLIFVITAVAGCGSKKVDFTAEDPVTAEQLNTEGKYVARGYFESIFLYNRDMFEKCFPEGYVEELGKATGVDVFEQFKNATQMKGTFMGAANADYKDYTVENGYDAGTMRSNICRVVGCEYSDIGSIQIQNVQAMFMNEKANDVVNFYFVVYEMNGKWFMYETYTEVAGF